MRYDDIVYSTVFFLQILREKGIIKTIDMKTNNLIGGAFVILMAAVILLVTVVVPLFQDLIRDLKG